MATPQFPTIIPEKIFIDSIKILGGSIESTPEANPANKAAYDVTFEVMSDMLPEDRLHRFIIGIYIEAVDVDKNPIGIKGRYNIEYIFRIENQDDFIERIDEEDKRIILHPILPNTLASIVYSTSRGIVLSRTQGTLLEDVILPVINPNELIKQFESQKATS